MPHLHIILEGDNAAEEARDSPIHHVQDFKVAALEGGMTSGAPSIAFIIPLEDGSFVIAETSLKLFLTAADLFKAKYGDPR